MRIAFILLLSLLSISCTVSKRGEIEIPEPIYQADKAVYYIVPRVVDKYGRPIEDTRVRRHSSKILRPANPHPSADGSQNREKVMYHNVVVDEKMIAESDELYKHLYESLLVASLVRYKNFKVISPKFVQFSKGGRLRYKRGRKASAHLYYVEVHLSDLNASVVGDVTDISADYNSDDSALVSIAKLPLMIGSFWVNTLTGLPTSYYSKNVAGLATVDIKIVDGRNGRIVKSFPVSGTYQREEKEYGNRVFGFYSKTAGGSLEMEALAVAIESSSERILEELERYERGK